ncbi:MAG: SagB/ThcOx family dehydrogenase [Acidobacteriota bacterium]
MNELIRRSRSVLKITADLLQQVEQAPPDEARGVPPPPLEKPCPPNLARLVLPKEPWTHLQPCDLFSALARRRSHRRYTTQALDLVELAWLLWATQGIRQRVNATTAFRTVPSSGCRHAIETYLAVLRIAGLEEGVYRYLPVEHELVQEFCEPGLAATLTRATLGQSFVGDAAVVFIWTTVPYRMEWRYSLAAHKAIAIDVGHVGQNLYLACEAIHAGTCAIGAYDQDMLDRWLRLDGQDEFTVHLASVGRI